MKISTLLFVSTSKFLSAKGSVLDSGSDSDWLAGMSVRVRNQNWTRLVSHVPDSESVHVPDQTCTRLVRLVSQAISKFIVRLGLHWLAMNLPDST
jgi:hypothetical protein